jgi:hypothetical protein
MGLELSVLIRFQTAAFPGISFRVHHWAVYVFPPYVTRSPLTYVASAVHADIPVVAVTTGVGVAVTVTVTAGAGVVVATVDETGFQTLAVPGVSPVVHHRALYTRPLSVTVSPAV